MGKHKMAGMDDSDDESFVTIGTALSPLLEDEVPAKPLSYAEQSVRDAKGRAQRFHGAFTGGFSAGYFNTVGTKEGWKPSTFVSTRNKKAERQQYNPEDFMDDEDLTVHGIAPKEVTTTQRFTPAVQEKKRKFTEPGAIPAADFLQDFIVPASIPMGVRLLRQLGWKEGQGIGPRVKKKSRKKKQSKSEPGKKTYGCALPPTGSESEESSEDEFAQGLTFAPKDVNPVNFTPKDDVHGLGYRGIDPRSAMQTGHINLFQKPGITGRTGRKGITGKAFGTGVLHEDDEDIYHTDHMSNYDRVLGGPEDDPMHGWTAPGMGGVGQPAIGYIQELLEGFKLSSNKERSSKIYPPPQLPRGFKPFHQMKLPEPPSGGEILPSAAAPSSGASLSFTVSASKSTTLTAHARAAMLGESIFDLVPKQDRERMEAAKLGTSQNLKQGTSQQTPMDGADTEQTRGVTLQQAAEHVEPAKVSDAREQRPLSNRTSRFDEPKPNRTEGDQSQSHVEAERAGTAPYQGTGAFKPFAQDEAKQQRYERYLTLVKQGKPYEAEEADVSGMTEWERAKEKESFARSAQLYRPLSRIMASRFTRAQHDDDTDKVDVPAQQEEDKNDQVTAAKMKMFGKLTRDRFEWHPDKVLCKRFNIPNPYPDSSIVGVPKVKRDKFSLFNFLTVPEEPKPAPASEQPAKPPPKPKQLQWIMEPSATTTSSIPLPDEQSSQEGSSAEKPDAEQSEKLSPQNNEDEESRPPMDLFKAIFEDSQSSSESSSDEEVENEEPESDSKREEVPRFPVPVAGARDQAQEKKTGSVTFVQPNPSSASQEVNASDTATEANITSSPYGTKQQPTSQTEPTEASGSTLIPSLEQRLNPAVESTETVDRSVMYGPKPPPTNDSETVAQRSSQTKVSSRDQHRKKKHKHRARSRERELGRESDRDRSEDSDQEREENGERGREKEKSSSSRERSRRGDSETKKGHKHKKKKKKHKKEKRSKKKEKKHKREKYTSSSDDDSDSKGEESDDSSQNDNTLPSDLQLLQRLKTLPSHKRPRASDFM